MDSGIFCVFRRKSLVLDMVSLDMVSIPQSALDAGIRGRDPRSGILFLCKVAEKFTDLMEKD